MCTLGCAKSCTNYESDADLNFTEFLILLTVYRYSYGVNAYGMICVRANFTGSRFMDFLIQRKFTVITITHFNLSYVIKV